MPWVFAFGAFTAISFSIGALFDVLRRLTEGTLSSADALQVLVLQLPRFMVLALPMSMLLAPLLTYSQLAQRNELMALKACGTSVYRIVRPVICFSLIVAVSTLTLNEWIVPPATAAVNRLLAQHPASQIAAIPSQNIVHKTYRHQRLIQLFYARTFDGEALHQLTILQFQDRHLHHIWLAQQATWNTAQQQWTLSQGTRYTIDPISGLYQHVVSFKQQPFQRISPQELAEITSNPINLHETAVLMRHVQQSGNLQTMQHLQVRWHSLMAFPWIGVGFTLIGSALGCQSTSKQGSLGFGLSSLLIFVYYTFSFICQTLGDTGLWLASIAGWLPIVVLITLGSTLLHNSNIRSASY
ncbi:LptF/LptG family permease [Acaryochloris marina]|uniref:LptF/LptG family permease n=1 Tax=Acaryochloris marina TaxID=155978 RepID=UPI002016E706|nr:LptF/LptG family permease [Acaryochloris marina]